MVSVKGYNDAVKEITSRNLHKAANKRPAQGKIAILGFSGSVFCSFPGEKRARSGAYNGGWAGVYLERHGMRKVWTRRVFLMVVVPLVLAILLYLIIRPRENVREGPGPGDLGIGMALVWIEPGTFLMGVERAAVPREEDEVPQRRVGRLAL
jgi:formylglycine-generating enzyme required for sulfatase activity